MRIPAALFLAMLFAACSFGPPNLAPMLHQHSGPERNPTIGLLEFVASRAEPYHRRDAEGFRDSLLEFENLDWYYGFCFATTHLFAVPYMNQFWYNPGVGAGLKSDRVYAAVFVSTRMLVKQQELAYQVGLRLTDNVLLVLDKYRVEYDFWAPISGLFQQTDVTFTEMQDVIRFMPTYADPSGQWNIGPNVIYSPQRGIWGAGLSISYSEFLGRKPK